MIRNPIYGKIKLMFQTTNQISYLHLCNLSRCQLEQQLMRRMGQSRINVNRIYFDRKMRWYLLCISQTVCIKKRKKHMEYHGMSGWFPIDFRSNNDSHHLVVCWFPTCNTLQSTWTAYQSGLDVFSTHINQVLMNPELILQMLAMLWANINHTYHTTFFRRGLAWSVANGHKMAICPNTEGPGTLHETEYSWWPIKMSV